MSLLGYKETDIHLMMNAIHDAKIYYLVHADVNQGDEPPIVDGLLNAIEFFYGLLQEGYFDE